jgi:hypothetical protein
MPRVIHSDGGESDEESILTRLSGDEQDMEIDPDSDDEEDVPLAYLKRQHMQKTAVVQSGAVELVKTIEVTMEKTVVELQGAEHAVMEQDEKDTQKKTTTNQKDATNAGKENTSTEHLAVRLARLAPRPPPIAIPLLESPRLSEDVPRSEQIRLRRDAESSAAPSEAGSIRRGSLVRGGSVASSVGSATARVGGSARNVSYPTSPTAGTVVSLYASLPDTDHSYRNPHSLVHYRRVSGPRQSKHHVQETPSCPICLKEYRKKPVGGSLNDTDSAQKAMPPPQQQRQQQPPFPHRALKHVPQQRP